MNFDHYRQLIDSADDAIVSIDMRQNIILFNKGAEKLFGYNSPEVIGRPLSVLLPRRFRTKHKAHVKKFGESGAVSRPMTTRSANIYALRKDGTEVAVMTSLVRTEVNGQTVFTAMHRDISETRNHLERLQSSNHTLTNTLDKILSQSPRTEVLDIVQDSTPRRG